MTPRIKTYKAHIALRENTARREREIIRVYALCDSQRQTAKRLGLHPSTVCKVFKRIGERIAP